MSARRGVLIKNSPGERIANARRWEVEGRKGTHIINISLYAEWVCAQLNFFGCTIIPRRAENNKLLSLSTRVVCVY